MIAYMLYITVDENFEVHLARCDREKKKVHRECLYDRSHESVMVHETLGQCRTFASAFAPILQNYCA